MSNMKVSVIVPIYNGEQFVAACVNQLLAQTIGDIEIILINDGSTDRTGELCDKYTGESTKCKVYHQQNKGVSAARNVGMSIAGGDYIGFVDVDDEYETDLFERLYTIAVEYKADVVCQNSDGKRGDVHVYNGSEAAVKAFLQRKIGMSAWGKLFKRDMIHFLQFPEEYEINEDGYAIYSALKASRCTVCQNANSYHYIHREGSTSRKKVFSGEYFDAVEINNFICDDVCQKYSNLRQTAYIRKVFTYLFISKYYYLRGKPKCYRNRIHEMKDYLKSKEARNVINQLKWTEKIRYYLYIYCLPLFILMIKTIDKK